MSRVKRHALGALMLATLASCGADSARPLPQTAPSVGPAARHRPPSLGARAARGLPIRGLRCTRNRGDRFGVHLELFAARRVVLVPPIDRAAPPVALGKLFAVWGQPLRRTRMAGFRGRVRAYVNGERRPGAPGAIPLRPHAQIVLEMGAYVRPHARYRFPPGL